MPPRPTKHIQKRREDNVRIGPISVITLIVVICMAVMGVLAASTSYATTTISQRQAAATQDLYANERAAQEFVASIDDVLAGVRASGGNGPAAAQAVKGQLDAICEHARAAADGQVSCTASLDNTTVNAEFVCNKTRLLSVAVTLQDNATYRIDRWKMTSAQPDAQEGGTLWMGE